MDINELHSKIAKHWTGLSQRVLGYVVHALPTSVGTGPKQFTDDWALIDIYRDGPVTRLTGMGSRETFFILVRFDLPYQGHLV